MFQIAHSPIDFIVDVINGLYPGYDAKITWVESVEDDEGEDACGMTFFPDDDSTPVIGISIQMPLSGVVEVIAHEAAHVIAGPDAEHGEEWESVFAAIHTEYTRRVLVLAQESKGQRLSSVVESEPQSIDPTGDSP